MCRQLECTDRHYNFRHNIRTEVYRRIGHPTQPRLHQASQGCGTRRLVPKAFKWCGCVRG